MKCHDWIFLMFTTIICCSLLIPIVQAQQRGRVKFGMSIQKDEIDTKPSPEIVPQPSQARPSPPRASGRFRTANQPAIPVVIEEESKDASRVSQRGSRGRSNDRSSRKLTAEATEAIPVIRSRKRLNPVPPSDQPTKVQLPTSSIDRTNIIRKSKSRPETASTTSSPSPANFRKRSDLPSDGPEPGPTESVRKVRTFTSRSVTKQADEVFSSAMPLTVATTNSNWKNVASKRGAAKAKFSERKSKSLDEDQLEDENYPEHFKILLKKQQPSPALLPKNYPRLAVQEDPTYSKFNEVYEAPKIQAIPRRLEQTSQETSDEILQVSRAIPKVRRVELKREDTARAALKTRRVEPQRDENIETKTRIEEPLKSRHTDVEKLRSQVKTNKAAIKSRRRDPLNEAKREDSPNVPSKPDKRAETLAVDNEPEVKPNEIEEATKSSKSLFVPRRAEPYRPKPKTTTQRPTTTSKPIKKPDVLDVRAKFKNRLNSRLQFPSLKTKTSSEEGVKDDNEVVHSSSVPPPVRPLQITKSRHLAFDRPVVDTRSKSKPQKFSSRYRGDAFSRYQQKTEPSKPIYTPTIPALTTEPVPRQLDQVTPYNLESHDLNKSASMLAGVVYDESAGVWNMVEPVAGGLTRSEISVDNGDEQQQLPQSAVTVSIFEALADILSKTPTTTTSTSTTTTTTTSTTELPDIIQVPELKIDSISSTTVNTHDSITDVVDDENTTTTNEIITNNDRDGRLLNSVEINPSTTIITPYSLSIDPNESFNTVTVPQYTSDTTLLSRFLNEQTTPSELNDLTTLALPASPTQPTPTNITLTNLSTNQLELTTLASNLPTSLPVPLLADALTTPGSSLITHPQLISAISNFLDTSVQNASDTMATSTTNNTTTGATLDTNSTPPDASSTLSPPITTTFTPPSTGSPPVTISFLDLFTIQAKKVSQNTEPAVEVHPIYKGPEPTTTPASEKQKQPTGKPVNINTFLGTQTYPSISVAGGTSTDRAEELSNTFRGVQEEPVTGGVPTDTNMQSTSTLEQDTSTLDYTTSPKSPIRTQSLPIHLNSILGSTQKYEQTSPFKTVQTEITTTIRSRFGNRRIPILPAGSIQSTTRKISKPTQTSSTTPVSTTTTVTQVSPENNQELSNFTTTTTETSSKTKTERTPIQDFSVYGILPNNTVIRKRPPQVSRKLDIGIMVYGILPNQTVVRKYPNGTLMIVDSSQDVEVIDIDPKMLFNPFSELYRTSQSSLLLTTHRSTTSHRLIESNHILSSSASSSTEVPDFATDGSGRRGNSIKETTESGNTDSTLTTNTDDENLIQWLSENEDNILNSTSLIESNTENAVLLDLLKRKYIKADLPSKSSNVVSFTTARNVIDETSLQANKGESVSENTLFDSSEEKKKDSAEDLFLSKGVVMPNRPKNNDDENVISKQFDTSYANVGIGSIFAGTKGSQIDNSESTTLYSSPKYEMDIQNTPTEPYSINTHSSSTIINNENHDDLEDFLAGVVNQTHGSVVENPNQGLETSTPKRDGESKFIDFGILESEIDSEANGDYFMDPEDRLKIVDYGFDFETGEGSGDRSDDGIEWSKKTEGIDSSGNPNTKSGLSEANGLPSPNTTSDSLNVNVNFQTSEHEENSTDVTGTEVNSDVLNVNSETSTILTDSENQNTESPFIHFVFPESVLASSEKFSDIYTTVAPSKNTSSLFESENLIPSLKDKGKAKTSQNISIGLIDLVTTLKPIEGTDVEGKDFLPHDLVVTTTTPNHDGISTDYAILPSDMRNESTQLENSTKLSDKQISVKFVSNFENKTTNGLGEEGLQFENGTLHHLATAFDISHKGIANGSQFETKSEGFFDSDSKMSDDLDSLHSYVSKNSSIENVFGNVKYFTFEYPEEINSGDFPVAGNSSFIKSFSKFTSTNLTDASIDVSTNPFSFEHPGEVSVVDIPVSIISSVHEKNSSNSLIPLILPDFSDSSINNTHNKASVIQASDLGLHRDDSFHPAVVDTENINQEKLPSKTFSFEHPGEVSVVDIPVSIISSVHEKNSSNSLIPLILPDFSDSSINNTHNKASVIQASDLGLHRDDSFHTAVVDTENINQEKLPSKTFSFEHPGEVSVVDIPVSIISSVHEKNSSNSLIPLILPDFSDSSINNTHNKASVIQTSDLGLHKDDFFHTTVVDTEDISQEKLPSHTFGTLEDTHNKASVIQIPDLVLNKDTENISQEKLPGDTFSTLEVSKVSNGSVLGHYEEEKSSSFNSATSVHKESDFAPDLFNMGDSGSSLGISVSTGNDSFTDIVYQNNNSSDTFTPNIGISSEDKGVSIQFSPKKASEVTNEHQSLFNSSQNGEIYQENIKNYNTNDPETPIVYVKNLTVLDETSNTSSDFKILDKSAGNLESQNKRQEFLTPTKTYLVENVNGSQGSESDKTSGEVFPTTNQPLIEVFVSGDELNSTKNNKNSNYHETSFVQTNVYSPIISPVSKVNIYKTTDSRSKVLSTETDFKTFETENPEPGDPVITSTTIEEDQENPEVISKDFSSNSNSSRFVELDDGKLVSEEPVEHFSPSPRKQLSQKPNFDNAISEESKQLLEGFSRDSLLLLQNNESKPIKPIAIEESEHVSSQHQTNKENTSQIGSGYVEDLNLSGESGSTEGSIQLITNNEPTEERLNANDDENIFNEEDSIVNSESDRLYPEVSDLETTSVPIKTSNSFTDLNDHGIPHSTPTNDVSSDIELKLSEKLGEEFYLPTLDSQQKLGEHVTRNENLGQSNRTFVHHETFEPYSEILNESNRHEPIIESAVNITNNEFSEYNSSDTSYTTLNVDEFLKQFEEVEVLTPYLSIYNDSSHGSFETNSKQVNEFLVSENVSTENADTYNKTKIALVTAEIENIANDEKQDSIQDLPQTNTEPPKTWISDFGPADTNIYLNKNLSSSSDLTLPSEHRNFSSVNFESQHISEKVLGKAKDTSSNKTIKINDSHSKTEDMTSSNSGEHSGASSNNEKELSSFELKFDQEGFENNSQLSNGTSTALKFGSGSEKADHSLNTNSSSSEISSKTLSAEFMEKSPNHINVDLSNINTIPQIEILSSDDTKSRTNSSKIFENNSFTGHLEPALNLSEKSTSSEEKNISPENQANNKEMKLEELEYTASQSDTTKSSESYTGSAEVSVFIKNTTGNLPTEASLDEEHLIYNSSSNVQPLREILAIPEETSQNATESSHNIEDIKTKYRVGLESSLESEFLKIPQKEYLGIVEVETIKKNDFRDASAEAFNTNYSTNASNNNFDHISRQNSSTFEAPELIRNAASESENMTQRTDTRPNGLELKNNTPEKVWTSAIASEIFVKSSSPLEKLDERPLLNSNFLQSFENNSRLSLASEVPSQSEDLRYPVHSLDEPNVSSKSSSMNETADSILNPAIVGNSSLQAQINVSSSVGNENTIPEFIKSQFDSVFHISPTFSPIQDSYKNKTPDEDSSQPIFLDPLISTLNISFGGGNTDIVLETDQHVVPRKGVVLNSTEELETPLVAIDFSEAISSSDNEGIVGSVESSRNGDEFLHSENIGLNSEKGDFILSNVSHETQEQLSSYSQIKGDVIDSSFVIPEKSGTSNQNSSSIDLNKPVLKKVETVPGGSSTPILDVTNSPIPLTEPSPRRIESEKLDLPVHIPLVLEEISLLRSSNSHGDSSDSSLDLPLEESSQKPVTSATEKSIFSSEKAQLDNISSSVTEKNELSSNFQVQTEYSTRIPSIQSADLILEQHFDTSSEKSSTSKADKEKVSKMILELLNKSEYMSLNATDASNSTSENTPLVSNDNISEEQLIKKDILVHLENLKNRSEASNKNVNANLSFDSQTSTSKPAIQNSKDSQIIYKDIPFVESPKDFMQTQTSAKIVEEGLKAITKTVKPILNLFSTDSMFVFPSMSAAYPHATPYNENFKKPPAVFYPINSPMNWESTPELKPAIVVPANMQAGLETSTEPDNVAMIFPKDSMPKLNMALPGNLHKTYTEQRLHKPLPSLKPTSQKSVKEFLPVKSNQVKSPKERESNTPLKPIYPPSYFDESSRDRTTVRTTTLEIKGYIPMKTTSPAPRIGNSQHFPIFVPGGIPIEFMPKPEIFIEPSRSSNQKSQSLENKFVPGGIPRELLESISPSPKTNIITGSVYNSATRLGEVFGHFSSNNVTPDIVTSSTTPTPLGTTENVFHKTYQFNLKMLKTTIEKVENEVKDLKESFIQTLNKTTNLVEPLEEKLQEVLHIQSKILNGSKESQVESSSHSDFSNNSSEKPRVPLDKTDDFSGFRSESLTKDNLAPLDQLDLLQETLDPALATRSISNAAQNLVENSKFNLQTMMKKSEFKPSYSNSAYQMSANALANAQTINSIMSESTKASGSESNSNSLTSADEQNSDSNSIKHLLKTVPIIKAPHQQSPKTIVESWTKLIPSEVPFSPVQNIEALNQKHLETQYTTQQHNMYQESSTISSLDNTLVFDNLENSINTITEPKQGDKRTTPTIYVVTPASMKTTTGIPTTTSTTPSTTTSTTTSTTPSTTTSTTTPVATTSTTTTTTTSTTTTTTTTPIPTTLETTTTPLPTIIFKAPVVASTPSSSIVSSQSPAEPNLALVGSNSELEKNIKLLEQLLQLQASLKPKTSSSTTSSTPPSTTTTTTTKATEAPTKVLAASNDDEQFLNQLRQLLLTQQQATKKPTTSSTTTTTTTTTPRPTTTTRKTITISPQNLQDLLNSFSTPSFTSTTPRPNNAEDIQFLNSLRDLGKIQVTTSAPTTFANRIIELALKNRTPKPTPPIFISTTVPPFVRMPEVKIPTILPANEIEKHQQDQASLSADLSLLSTLLGRRITVADLPQITQQFGTNRAKPAPAPRRTTTTTPRTTRPTPVTTEKPMTRDEIAEIEKNLNLLSSLLGRPVSLNELPLIMQELRAGRRPKGNPPAATINLIAPPPFKTIPTTIPPRPTASLQSQTPISQEEVIELLKDPSLGSPEQLNIYGQSNDAILAAVLKQRGIGPTHNNLPVNDLFIQRQTQPPYRPTRPPPPPPQQRRPVLDGLAWLWRTWQETAAPGNRVSKNNRQPSSAASTRLESPLAIGAFGGDTPTTATNSNDGGEYADLQYPQNTSFGQGNGLLTAAFSVTRAVSQFLGAAFQGAAQSVQSAFSPQAIQQPSLIGLSG